MRVATFLFARFAVMMRSVSDVPLILLCMLGRACLRFLVTPGTRYDQPSNTGTEYLPGATPRERCFIRVHHEAYQV